MKAETEAAVRSIIPLDNEITKEMMERAICILRGGLPEEDETIRVVRRKDALKILNVHRRTMDYYVKMGYLEKVFGCGRRRSLGITRESLIRFMRLRVGHPAPVASH